MSRLLFWLALASLLLTLLTLCSGEAHAHELHGNTARVSLRDGNVTILLHIEPGSSPELDALSTDTHLRLDGAEVPLEVHSAPTRKQLAAAAIEADLGGHGDSRMLRVELESTTSGWSGERLEVQFPPELGPVLVSFVQPQAQQLHAGGSAHFELSSPASSAPPAQEQRGWAWLALVLGLALAVGAGVGYMSRAHRRPAVGMS